MYLRILWLACVAGLCLLSNEAHSQSSPDSTQSQRVGRSVRTAAAANFERGVVMTAGACYLLKNIHFVVDRHQMKGSSNKELRALRSVLHANPKMKVRIEGHVCCIKDAPDALDVDNNEPYLSRNRAKAVYEYLVKKGIDKSRLSYEGLGRSRPIILYETNEAEAAINRRVEVRVLEN